MPVKRRRTHTQADSSTCFTPNKKARLSASAFPDHLSPLSDELLVRILSNLSLPQLLNIAPVSKRFHRLSEDSQLWKRLYYSRFVLPRALRIPGFRDGSARDGKLHYSSRRAVWADGRRGGWVDMHRDDKPGMPRDWKRQYKLRHNWSKGKCAVEELKVREDVAAVLSDEADVSPKMLVKICEGIAVTADTMSGLRAWDLRTKRLVAHTSLAHANSDAAPSCIALDDQDLPGQSLDIAVGFSDGSFGVWKLDVQGQRLLRKYRHEKSTNGALAGAAFSFPYLLTATESVLISLYTFDRPTASQGIGDQPKPNTETAKAPESHVEDGKVDRSAPSANTQPPKLPSEAVGLPAPYLLTSLKSHTSRAPLALSIRKTARGTMASIAYTFSTLRGWSLGLQELHLKPPSSSSRTAPEIAATRLAYTLPIDTSGEVSSPPTLQAKQRISTGHGRQIAAEDGPIGICYTHPYLLATLPDNTLLLYVCTSGASSLSISPGIRLWGHTSGISDAEITARGKAVSVSCRGEEIRVWELEGRADGRSIEVRPSVPVTLPESIEDEVPALQANVSALDERRNWVGFDDEMVIVLKESRGIESLMVYDFT